MQPHNNAASVVPTPPVSPAFESVRSRVAETTRHAHEALHHHPVLKRLTAKDIQLSEYKDILGRYLIFYQAAERCREHFSLLPALSLHPEIELLQKDVPYASQPPMPDLAMGSAQQALGLLYVLYGARFGGRLIYQSLRAALPNDPHHFFSKPNEPTHWRELISAMESVWHSDADTAAVENGALIAFERFGLAMSEGNPSLPITLRGP